MLSPGEQMAEFIDALAAVMTKRKIFALTLADGLNIQILPAALHDKPAQRLPVSPVQPEMTQEIAGPFEAFRDVPPPPAWAAREDTQEPVEPGAFNQPDPLAEVDENRLFGTDLPQV
jgi:hypothetical protein